MKKSLTLLFLFISFFKISAQQPLVDAWTLYGMLDAKKEKFTASNKAEIEEILAKYVDVDRYNPLLYDMKVLYKDTFKNAVMTAFMPAVWQRSGDDKMEGSVLPGGNNRPMGFGGFNVTNLADGLARFLAARAKQELNATFFRKFKDFIGEQKVAGALFPSTRQILLAADENIYQYNYFVSVLRESFYQDYNQLGYNLGDFLETTEIERFQSPYIKRLAPDALRFVSDLQTGVSPFERLHSWAKSTYSNPDDKLEQVFSGIQIADILAQAVSDGEDLLETEKIERVFTNRAAYRLYLGLLFQQGLNVKVGKGQKLSDFVSKLAERESEFKFLIEEILKKVRNASSQLKVSTETSQKRMSEGVSVGGYDAGFIFKNVMALVEKGLTFKHLLMDNKQTQNTEDEERYLRLVNNFYQLIYTIKKEQYQSSVTYLSFVLSDILVSGEYEPIKKNILKYGSFMASAITAQSSAEVQAAIEAVALPVGSSALKKNSKFNLAVQAYVGGTFGNEYFMSQSLQGRDAKPIVGLTAPVGIGASWGLKGSSLTLFTSFIDVGAITAFRLGDNVTEDLPELSWSNIFAPGLHVYYGLPKIPVSIGFGGQLGPNLRKVDPTVLGVSEARFYRLGASLTLDIPIFNLLSRGE